MVAPVVFSTDSPVIAVTGLELPAPGSYAINTSMTWGGHGDVVGDLAGAIPEIQVTPALVPVTATLVVLGDVDLDGYVEFEIRDLQTLTMTVDQYVEGTLVIDVQVTATLLANLSGRSKPRPPRPSPCWAGRRSARWDFSRERSASGAREADHAVAEQIGPSAGLNGSRLARPIPTAPTGSKRKAPPTRTWRAGGASNSNLRAATTSGA